MAILFNSATADKRPVRLSEQTRQFAYESLNAKYGRALYENRFISLDEIENFETLSLYEKYDTMIWNISVKAPLRLCEHELVCGSATLCDAIGHIVPAKYHNEVVFTSMSHVTCGFYRVLDDGLQAYEKRILNRLNQPCNEQQKEFLHSLLNTYHAFQVWHKRYCDLILTKVQEAVSNAEATYYQTLYDNLIHVPFEKPQSFRESVQALWITFAFIRLCGNWPAIGRIDQILDPYLKNDLEQHKITIDDAREILAHFFIKGCEWITLDGKGSGDAQHYQNIVLGGIDGNGKEISNDVTKLVLEIVEELPIGDFPIAVRLTENPPKWLLTKVSEVMRHGSGVVAVYNDKLVLSSLVKYGYEFSDISMMLQNTIHSADFFFSMRTKVTVFSRDRTLSMRDILYFIMSSKNKALQTELDEFQEAKGGVLVTRQAFSKARENIDACVFEYLNYKLIKKYETEEANIKTYKGYRLLGGDASLIDLPNTPELREIYGYSSCGNSEKTYAKARAMTIYDVLNNLTVSAKLLSYNDSERTAIHTFADELKASGWYDKSILLLDRG